MKILHFILHPLSFILSALTLLANAAQAAADALLIGNAFPFAGGKRVQLSPYGDFPHGAGLQRLTVKEAGDIVANFNLQKIADGAKFGGLPFFIGHPDVPEFAERFPDTRAAGWILSLEAAPDGLYGNVDWTPFGAPLIEGREYKFLSPTWFIQRGSDGVLHPVQLKSAGLTNTPNIPVAPLANAQPTQNKGYTMPTWLLELLGLPADATEDQAKTVLAEWSRMKMETPANIAALASEKTRADTAETALANEKKRAETALQSLGKERQARADLALAGAIAEGRITEADQAGWRTALLANEAKFAEMAALKPVIKTESKTQGLKNRAAPSAAIANIHALVQKRMKDNGECYDTAWANTKREKPELFANLKTPESN
ncbi:MAG: hypothetical protein HY360_07655 [Verrucomicrobia bacterium]|nr:hypothetical protein [Verrucomicrobiota bacterium]